MDAEVSPGATLSLEKVIAETSRLLERVTVVSPHRAKRGNSSMRPLPSHRDPRAKELYGGAGQIPSMLAGVPARN
jgi:hypothetical protein